MPGLRRTTRTFLIVGVIMIFALLAAGVVAAVNAASGPLEIDGNAVDNAGGGIDWEDVYAEPDGDTAHQQFLTDNPASDEIFTGGGSKDINDISEWRHSIGSVPDKDDILHSYMAAYSVDGDLMLYFGADRFANNGDAQIGVWLFHDNVQLLPDGTFSGTHHDGDILILSNFVGGGDDSSVEVYRWNGTADPANPLQLLAEADAAGQFSVCTSGDLACAFTNEQRERSPWPYEPKSGGAGFFPTVSFFEGGVNLTKLLGNQGLGCYSSFLMETRSSHQDSAQLKDLSLGSFPVCGLEINKAGDARSAVGNEVTYRFTITNTSLIPLTQQSVSDDVLGDLSVTADCQTLAPGASCEFEVPYTVPASAADPLKNIVSASFVSARDDVVSATDDHETNLFQPSITFDKSVNAASARVGDELTYTLTLVNTSSPDTPALTCTIRDSMLGINERVNLVSGQPHTIILKYNVKGNDASPLVNTASVRCEVDGYNNVLEASDNASVPIIAVAPTATPSDTPTNTATATSTPTNTIAPTNTSVPATNTNAPNSTNAPTVTPVPPTATSIAATSTDMPPTTEIQPITLPTNTPHPTNTPKFKPTEEAAPAQAPIDNSVKGCSPGFWQGGHGRWLWNEANDPQWAGNDTNPFTHDAVFNSVFAPYSATEDFVVMDFVGNGGGPRVWRKAARNVVAGYLNASYGMNYPYTPAEVAKMWADAVSESLTFADVHRILGEANNLGCPIGK